MSSTPSAAARRIMLLGPICGILISLLSSCQEQLDPARAHVVPTTLFGADPEDLTPLVGNCGAWQVTGPVGLCEAVLFWEIWRDGECVENKPRKGNGRLGLEYGPVQGDRIEALVFAATDELPGQDRAPDDRLMITLGVAGSSTRVTRAVPEGGIRVDSMLDEARTYAADEDIILGAIVADERVGMSGPQDFPDHGESGHAIYLKLRFFESD